MYGEETGEMKSRDTKSRCLSDDEVAAYVDGAVRPDLRKRIEEHLARCGDCLHNVAELKHLVGAASAAVKMPAAALARAESIVERELSPRGEMIAESMSCWHSRAASAGSSRPPVRC